MDMNSALETFATSAMICPVLQSSTHKLTVLLASYIHFFTSCAEPSANCPHGFGQFRTLDCAWTDSGLQCVGVILEFSTRICVTLAVQELYSLWRRVFSLREHFVMCSSAGFQRITVSTAFRRRKWLAAYESCPTISKERPAQRTAKAGDRSKFQAGDGQTRSLAKRRWIAVENSESNSRRAWAGKRRRTRSKFGSKSDRYASRSGLVLAGAQCERGAVAHLVRR